jgi:hypothetical protein
VEVEVQHILQVDVERQEDLEEVEQEDSQEDQEQLIQVEELEMVVIELEQDQELAEMVAVAQEQ